jgi:hypothetical protein
MNRRRISAIALAAVAALALTAERAMAEQRRVGQYLSWQQMGNSPALNDLPSAPKPLAQTPGGPGPGAPSPPAARKPGTREGDTPTLEFTSAEPKSFQHPDLYKNIWVNSGDAPAAKPGSRTRILKTK